MTEDYSDRSGDDDDSYDSDYNNSTKSKARLVIIATGVVGVLLIIVVAAILCKLLLWPHKSHLSLNHRLSHSLSAQFEKEEG